MIYQKFLAATIFKVEGKVDKNLVKKNIEIILQYPYIKGGRSAPQ